MDTSYHHLLSFSFFIEAVLPYFLTVIVSIYLLLKENTANISVKPMQNLLMASVQMVDTSNKQPYLNQSDCNEK